MAEPPQGRDLVPMGPQGVVPSRNLPVGSLTPGATDVERVVRPEDEYSALDPELRDLAKRAPFPKEQAKEASPPRGSVVAKIVLTCLHLGFALGGFLYLNIAGALLWFLFLLVVYPILLAFLTRAETLNSGDLLAIYKAGISQIPAIGRILSPVLNSKKND